MDKAILADDIYLDTTIDESSSISDKKTSHSVIAAS